MVRCKIRGIIGLDATGGQLDGVKACIQPGLLLHFFSDGTLLL
jgi:hypothetical protein